jgi:hypothetical protein
MCPRRFPRSPRRPASREWREGQTAYLDADLRDPAKILAQAAETLDFSRPITVLLIAVLHFVQDSDDMPEAERRYNERASAQFNARVREQVSRFFDGLELTGPAW